MGSHQDLIAHLAHDLPDSQLAACRRAMENLEDLEGAVREEGERAGDSGARAPLAQARALAAAARGLVTVTTSLLGACGDTEDFPAITYLQCKVLVSQMPPIVDAAWQALGNPRFRAAGKLPRSLEPRIPSHGRRAPTHLSGLEAAARALLSHAASNPRSDASAPAARESAALRARAEARLAAGAASLTAGDTRGAEEDLFGAAADAFLLAQLVVLEDAPDATSLGLPNAPGRSIAPEDRWSLSHGSVAAELRDTPHGEMAIREFWESKGWRLTAREETYLRQCQALLEHGALRVLGRWFAAPFDPVYRTVEPIRLLDIAIDAGCEVRLDMDLDRDELAVGAPHLRGCRPLRFEEVEDVA